jgi:hypothetical protein
MTDQAVINDRQTSINKGQNAINDNQNTINERTKIDLSVPSFWGIIVLVIGVTSFYLLNQYNTSSDIKDMRKDISYIKLQNDEILKRYTSLENRYGDISLQVRSLETILNIR